MVNKDTKQSVNVSDKEYLDKVIDEAFRRSIPVIIAQRLSARLRKIKPL